MTLSRTPFYVQNITAWISHCRLSCAYYKYGKDFSNFHICHNSFDFYNFLESIVQLILKRNCFHEGRKRLHRPGIEP